MYIIQQDIPNTGLGSKDGPWGVYLGHQVSLKWGFFFFFGILGMI